MKKSEDTPAEKCSKDRRVPTETGFKLRVPLPSSQQFKVYPSVTFCPIAGPAYEDHAAGAFSPLYISSAGRLLRRTIKLATEKFGTAAGKLDR
jgi:hypothetical protein